MYDVQRNVQTNLYSLTDVLSCIYNKTLRRFGA